MQNWFNTLNEALDSEGLMDKWPLGTNIEYDSCERVYVEEGKNIRLITVYRDNRGMYERPVHYLT